MVIAHLYKDLLNLYGNDGNTKILKNKLQHMGYDVVVEEPTIGDDINFEKYDLVFIGSGTESNQLLALKDIMRYKNSIEKAIENGTIFLAMGNSVDMFGECLIDSASNVTPALGIFSFKSKWVDRIKGDVKRSSTFIDAELLGFENHNYVMVDENGQRLENMEIIKNNFFGSYIEGPILVRNPEFLRKIIMLMTGGKTEGLDLKLEETARDNFIKILDGGIN